MTSATIPGDSENLELRVLAEWPEAARRRDELALQERAQMALAIKADRQRAAAIHVQSTWGELNLNEAEADFFLRLIRVYLTLRSYLPR